MRTEVGGFLRKQRHFRFATFVARRSALFPSIVIGIVVWVIALVYGASFVALIFQGELAPYYYRGLGVFLVSSITLCLFTALFSSDKSAIPSPQDTTAIIVASMAANLTLLAPTDMPAEILSWTVVVTIALSSIICGVFFLICGVSRIANLVRFLPYPVVGGFIAGVGWLLVRGAISLMVDSETGDLSLSRIFSLELLQVWLPALLMAIAMLLSLRFGKNMLLFPAVIIVSMLLLGGLEHYKAAPMDEALATDQAAAREFDSIELVSLAQIPWTKIDFNLVLSQVGSFGALIVFCTMHLLLVVSGQELIGNRELDFNRELSAAGAGNLAASLVGGGFVGFTTIAYTTFVNRAGANGRIVNIIMCLGFLLTPSFGASLFRLLPLAVLGGTLMYMGIDFLVTWLYDAWFKMPAQDYLMVVLILLVIANFGFLWGIAIGLLIAIIFFVLKYSRVSIIKHEFATGATHSNIERSHVESSLLNERSDRIHVVRLQGFIFFGSMRQFYQYISDRMRAPASRNLQFVILDFRSVQGIDISAAVDINKLIQKAEMRGISILLSSVSPQIKKVLYTRSGQQDELKPFPTFDDLDHATEWCENQLIEQEGLLQAKQVTLEELFGNHAMIRKLDISAVHRYLEPVVVAAGDYLAHQGEEVDDLFIIESGRVDIIMHLEFGNDLRLRSMTAGTIVGEVGFYLGARRSASICVTEPGIFHRLSRGALQRMQKDDPQAAVALHTFISCVLSERLTNTNRMVEFLLD